MAGTQIKVSQGFEVLKPKSDQAFPVPCAEWDVLKNQIDSLSFESQFFQTFGWLLLGSALSTIISVWTGAISTTTVKNADVIAWAVIAVCVIAGLMCLLFAHKERNNFNANAKSIVTQMNLIEQRFDR